MHGLRGDFWVQVQPKARPRENSHLWPPEHPAWENSKTILSLPDHKPSHLCNWSHTHTHMISVYLHSQKLTSKYSLRRTQNHSASLNTLNTHYTSCNSVFPMILPTILSLFGTTGEKVFEVTVFFLLWLVVTRIVHRLSEGKMHVVLKETCVIWGRSCLFATLFFNCPACIAT